MSKTKFTKADVERAFAGVIDGGGTLEAVEIWPDGHITVVTAKKTSPYPPIDPEDDPEVSRRLL